VTRKRNEKLHQPIGRLDPDELLAHRELEYLRCAATVRGRKGRRALDLKAEKLQEAKRVASKYGRGGAAS
jgi:hypothetical protein